MGWILSFNGISWYYKIELKILCTSCGRAEQSSSKLRQSRFCFELGAFRIELGNNFIPAVNKAVIRPYNYSIFQEVRHIPQAWEFKRISSKGH